MLSPRLQITMQKEDDNENRPNDEQQRKQHSLVPIVCQPISVHTPMLRCSTEKYSGDDDAEAPRKFYLSPDGETPHRILSSQSLIGEDIDDEATQASFRRTSGGSDTELSPFTPTSDEDSEDEIWKKTASITPPSSIQEPPASLSPPLFATNRSSDSITEACLNEPRLPPSTTLRNLQPRTHLQHSFMYAPSNKCAQNSSSSSQQSPGGVTWMAASDKQSDTLSVVPSNSVTGRPFLRPPRAPQLSSLQSSPYNIGRNSQQQPTLELACIYDFCTNEGGASSRHCQTFTDDSNFTFLSALTDVSGEHSIPRRRTKSWDNFEPRRSRGHNKRHNARNSVSQSVIPSPGSASIPASILQPILSEKEGNGTGIAPPQSIFAFNLRKPISDPLPWSASISDRMTQVPRSSPPVTGHMAKASKRQLSFSFLPRAAKTTGTDKELLLESDFVSRERTNAISYQENIDEEKMNWSYSVNRKTPETMNESFECVENDGVTKYALRDVLKASREPSYETLLIRMVEMDQLNGSTRVFFNSYLVPRLQHFFSLLCSTTNGSSTSNVKIEYKKESTGLRFEAWNSSETPWINLCSLANKRCWSSFLLLFCLNPLICGFKDARLPCCLLVLCAALIAKNVIMTYFFGKLVVGKYFAELSFLTKSFLLIEEISSAVSRPSESPNFPRNYDQEIGSSVVYADAILDAITAEIDEKENQEVEVPEISVPPHTGMLSFCPLALTSLPSYILQLVTPQDTLDFHNSLLSSGNGYSREQWIESAQSVFDLLTKEYTDKKLDLNVLGKVVQPSDSYIDREKIRILVKIFGANGKGKLSKMDFILSIDRVYKNRGLLLAKIKNTTSTFRAFACLVDVIFYSACLVVGYAMICSIGAGLFAGLFAIFLVIASSKKFAQGIFTGLLMKPFDIGDRIFLVDGDVTEGLSEPPCGGHIVEHVGLAFTDVRSATTGGKRRFENGSLWEKRIINLTKSCRAQIACQLKFDIRSTRQQLETFRKRIEMWLESRPREWNKLVDFRCVGVEPVIGFIEFTMILEHEESWQQFHFIQESRSEMLLFALELQRELNVLAATSSIKG